MFKIENGRLSFYQWDINQRLIIENPSITEVHFCNRTSECSLVTEVYEENGKRFANVPNILLQEDWTIRVYAYCADYTLIEEKFIVHGRSKPAAYIYTETEIKTFGTLERRMDELEESMSVVEDYLSANPAKGNNINAAAYGVSPNSADNSSALLAAIKNAIEVGSAVYIPAGTYVFTSPIELPEAVTVELVGVADAFANSMNREQIGGKEYHAKENGTTLIYRGEGAMLRHKSCVFKFNNLSLVSQDSNKNYLYNSRLVGLIFEVPEGGTEAQPNNTKKGKIYAENCLFAGWKTVAGDAFVTDELEEALGGTLTKPNVLEQCCIVAARCRFSFCGSALNMGVDSRLEDCSINKCYYGASFYGAAGFSTLANSRIEWCMFDGVIAKQSHDVLITGCEFDRCGYAAIRYEQCTGSSIIGNTIRRSGSDTSLTANAASRNVHIYIADCTGGVVTENITVKKNIFDDASSPIMRPVNAYNIQTNNKMVISNNDFNGCTTGTYNRFNNNTNCCAIGNLGLADNNDYVTRLAELEARITALEG